MDYDINKAFKVYYEKEKKEGRKPLPKTQYINVVISLIEVLKEQST